MLADSVSMTDVEINYDFHFTKAYPHLIIRKRSATDVGIDIFERMDERFKKVASYKISLNEHTGDSIYDVNSDGTKDFVMSRYGTSGCCLKAFSKGLSVPDREKNIYRRYRVCKSYILSPRENGERYLLRAVRRY